MKAFALTLIIATLLLLIGYQLINKNNSYITKSTQNPNTIRYVTVGDSYTIGLDVDGSESWPSILTRHLQSEGVEIELIDNLAVTGYTAEDVIMYELPVYEKLNPHFATILIGANDSSLGISTEEFRNNLVRILDSMLARLTNKSFLIVLTIPNYTHTPRGKVDFSDELYSQSIRQFNNVIRAEAEKRKLTVVDLEDINDGISSDSAYYTVDGLHPSAKQYELWEKRIYPKVKSILERK